MRVLVFFYTGILHCKSKHTEIVRPNRNHPTLRSSGSLPPKGGGNKKWIIPVQWGKDQVPNLGFIAFWFVSSFSVRPTILLSWSLRQTHVQIKPKLCSSPTVLRHYHSLCWFLTGWIPRHSIWKRRHTAVIAAGNGCRLWLWARARSSPFGVLSFAVLVLDVPSIQTVAEPEPEFPVCIWETNVASEELEECVINDRRSSPCLGATSKQRRMLRLHIIILRHRITGVAGL
jgi:hypothetical protein